MYMVFHGYAAGRPAPQTWRVGQAGTTSSTENCGYLGAKGTGYEACSVQKTQWRKPCTERDILTL